jgi:hypothetical protein
MGNFGIFYLVRKKICEIALAVYPKTAIQLCIVHLVRYSLNYVSWKLRKAVAADLRLIYAAATVKAAEARLTEFEEKWGPTIRLLCSPGAGVGFASSRSLITRQRYAVSSTPPMRLSR